MDKIIVSSIMRIKPYPSDTLFKILISSLEYVESPYSKIFLEIECTKVNLKSDHSKAYKSKKFKIPESF